MTSNEQELSRKLQVLQNQNRILQQSKDSFQSHIRRLLDNINDLDRQLLAKNQEIDDLKQRNKQVSSKSRKLQLQTESLRQQYSALYNFAGTQKKRGSRELILKEIQLSNRLNSIQNEGYSKVIGQLRNNLENKNDEIAALISENSRIKKDLLTTTYQFHQQIYALKEEIAAVKSEASALLQIQTSQTQTSCLRCAQNSAQNNLSTLKIQNLQKQISQCQRQYASISKELLQSKNQIHHYKNQAQWFQVKIHLRDSSADRAQVDIQRANELLKQNAKLIKELQDEKSKIVNLLEDYPSLKKKAGQLKVHNPYQELKKAVNELKSQLQVKEKDLALFKSSAQKLQEQKGQLEKILFRSKTNSRRVIEKLTQIIKKHVPYVNLYGLSEYGFDQEECKLLEQKNPESSKEYEKLFNDLIAQRTEIQKLKDQLALVQREAKSNQERVTFLTKSERQLREENKKLLLSLQKLRKKAYPPKRTGMQSSYYDLQEQEEQQKQPAEVQLSQRQQQIANLRLLVQELQQDRQKTLGLIRNKDLMIAEANAQIAFLKSQVTSKKYNFGTFAAFPKPDFYQLNQRKSQTNNNPALFLQQSESKYYQFQNALRTMSQKYENQIRLLNEQHNKKYSNLDLKYSKLLNQFTKFQEQYNKLQQAYEESTKKNENEGKRVDLEQSQKQINEQVQGAVNLRDDNNSINETTIQTINELLKKYEKEFNRFTQLYESEMVKANQLKHQSYATMETQSLEQSFKSQVQRVEAILVSNQQTISLLQKELKEKDQQLYSERQHYETSEHISDQRLAQLQMRCNELNAQIQSLQRKVLQSETKKQQGQEPKVQESAVLISVVNSKTSQIQSLKSQLKEKQAIIQQKRQEISALLAKTVDEQSRLQLQELKAFKSYLLENNLSDLLENIYQRIENAPPRSQ